MAIDRASHQQNRRSWNEATRAHRAHRPRQTEFFRDGGSTLYDEESALLGAVDGSEIVHLMCNAGQDSISLAGQGARVTGIDISDAAIEEARELADAAEAAATFERADIYDWLARTDARFDLAFSSYGVVPWLSDLEEWASGIERVLRPGGAFVLVDFHPVAVAFDERMELSYQYHRDEKYVFDEGVSDYVASSGESMAPGGFVETESFENPEASVEFPWTFADVLQALVSAGLRLERVEEYPYSNGWRIYDEMVDLGNRRWGFEDGEPNLPLMFGLRASKR